MKKIILSLAIFGFAFGSQAQSDKKVTAGLSYQFGLNFTKPGTKNIAKDGAGVQNSIGLNLLFKGNGSIGFATGVEFDFESLKYSMSQPTIYRFNDTQFLNYDETSTTDTKFYELDARKYKNVYVTIPTMMSFETNPIGDFVYYGKFGLRTSVLLKSSSNDEGKIFPGNIVTEITGTSQDNTAMKNKWGNDVWGFRSSLGLTVGAQWNFTGNTRVFGEIGYYYGITPVHNPSKNVDNMSLYTTDYITPTTESDYFRPKSNLSQLCLKVGILF